MCIYLTWMIPVIGKLNRYPKTYNNIITTFHLKLTKTAVIKNLILWKIDGSKIWQTNYKFGKIMLLQETVQKMKRSIPLKGVAAVFGGFLLQFTMGAFYSFGNMSTYMVSYMRQYGSPNLTYTDFIVVQSAWGMTQGTVMPFSGFTLLMRLRT